MDALFAAIEAHDCGALVRLLADGADANARRESGPQWTALQAAIEELEDGGDVEALVLLLRHGAHPDDRDGKHDSTPLLMAVFRGQWEAARILLAAGADPNVTGAEGDTALRWCVEQRDAEHAAMLLRCGAGAGIDSFGGPSGMSALGRAAHGLDGRMVELLLANGADAAARDADDFTARKRLPPRTAANARAHDAVAETLAAHGG